MPGKSNILNMKNISILVLAVFFLGSCFFIVPKGSRTKPAYHSSQLNKEYSLAGSVEKTEYHDNKGRVSFAADLGYAIKTVTKMGNSKLEEYFDEKEKPVKRNMGYYKVLREYNDKGYNIRSIYLDLYGEQITNSYGFSIEKCEYNGEGKVYRIRYYDINDEPVNTAMYGYGSNYEYDENGRVRVITYVDSLDNPIMTAQGYAIVYRNYYVTNGSDNGLIESEFYFDENGCPICLSLGQYGVHNEYDDYGRRKVLTYLDETGAPIKTNKGYTKVQRTFYTDNSVATELYFDLNGDPFSLPDGQFGIERRDGQTVYLDEQGNELFNLKAFLNNNPGFIVFIAIAIVLLSAILNRKWNIALLITYILSITYFTLMFRDNSETELRLGLFSSFRDFFIDSKIRSGIIKNIWLFIPLGAILYRLYPNRIILMIPFIISVLVEIIQLFSRTGFCEMDDIICNTLGGIVGYAMGKKTLDFKNIIVEKRLKK